MLSIKLPGPSSRSPKPKQSPTLCPSNRLCMQPTQFRRTAALYVEGRPVKATNRGQPWKEQLTLTDFFQRIHHCFNEIGASPRMRQEFAEYHAGNKPENKKSWHISGKRNIQMTRITGLDSSGRNELGMQDGLKAGMNQPVVHPPDGTRNGRDPKRLEVTLPGSLVVRS